ncbi:hypothetical protein BDDG_05895, partial [Blastomyces dermatitidis ATCC 18188]
MDADADMFVFICVELSHVDRSVSADDSEPDVESLVENLKDVIMKELPVSCVAGSPASLLAPSAASFSAAPPSVPFSATPQSPTLAPVSGSPAPATPVPATPTPATPGFTASAFVTSSPRFKKMLCRLGEPHLLMKDICVFRNENMNIVLFYICRFTSVSEIILIEDDNTAETTLFCSQASSVTFSSFSVRKVVHTLS